MVNIKTIAKSLLPEKLHGGVQSCYFRLRSFLYYGNNVECPCCGGHFRKFLSFGITARPNAQCPRCGLLERHRLFWLYLREKTDFFDAPMRLLDVAPTRLFQKLCRKLPNINYLSVDIDSPLAMQKADITDLSFEDDLFDCIICYHVLEHVSDDFKAMKELYRVLKPTGWAIIQSPIDYSKEKTYEDSTITSPSDRERAFGQSDHLRIYGRDYADRLKSAGFSVKEDDFVKQFSQEQILKFGLDRDEIIYLCTESK